MKQLPHLTDEEFKCLREALMYAATAMGRPVANKDRLDLYEKLKMEAVDVAEGTNRGFNLEFLDNNGSPVETIGPYRTVTIDSYTCCGDGKTIAYRQSPSGWWETRIAIGALPFGTRLFRIEVRPALLTDPAKK